ncbi:hypothetical protein NHX12_008957 [Muraenolepis orangiensis]|uniref:Uncharacterized protein n=1 Tax=Muraenolepis orangiensis TaxID=630683 RepID=A0A9Q0IAB6_9TELE|nr:hypothetical protein NHX12_008957 [Muraenolepis orangiensis]
MVPRSGAVPGVTPWSTTEGTYRDGLLALRPKWTLAAGVSPHGGGQVVQVSTPNQEERLSWRQRLHRSLNLPRWEIFPWSS